MFPHRENKKQKEKKKKQHSSCALCQMSTLQHGFSTASRGAPHPDSVQPQGMHTAINSQPQEMLKETEKDQAALSAPALLSHGLRAGEQQHKEQHWAAVLRPLHRPSATHSSGSLPDPPS